MALTDVVIRKLKPTGKRFKVSDTNGLILEVMLSGAKFFRYRFKLDGKESIYTIGEYPIIPLAMARQLRDEARALVKLGINPNTHKQSEKEQQRQELAKVEAETNKMTFTDLFHEWHGHNEKRWQFDYADDVMKRVTMHLLPTLGALPLDDIKPLKGIEALGRIDTMKKIRSYTGSIFKYGIGFGYCENNPAQNLPNDIFDRSKKKKNHPHLTKPKDLFQLLNAIDSYNGDVSTATALKLAPYLFLRPSELAGLKWREVDLTNNTITIEAERMKMKREHMAPLSKQAKEIILAMRDISGHCDYVFPSPRTDTRPLCAQTLNTGLHRLGYKGKQTVHGFRHTASTLLNEQGYNRDHIEKQLAREESNSVRDSYNKAEYLPWRKEVMQDWSDYLDALKRGGDVIPINQLKHG